jgi:hypothetical protein
MYEYVCMCVYVYVKYYVCVYAFKIYMYVCNICMYVYM